VDGRGLDSDPCGEEGGPRQCILPHGLLACWRSQVLARLWGTYERGSGQLIACADPAADRAALQDLAGAYRLLLAGQRPSRDQDVVALFLISPAAAGPTLLGGTNGTGMKRIVVPPPTQLTSGVSVAGGWARTCGVTFGP
jgi:hypothetical protein